MADRLGPRSYITRSLPVAVKRKPTSQAKRPWSPAEKCGMASLVCALVCWQFGPLLAIIPLAGFILACCVSPLFPTSSFFYPVISRGPQNTPAVSLSFDDGPNPQSTPQLLALLERHHMTATFYVTGEHARQYPDIMREIIDRGHSVGNHSHTHDDYIMFKSSTKIYQEIQSAQQVFQDLGITVKSFRPPVGIITPAYADALWQSGLIAINFSRRSGDMGNRRLRGMAKRMLDGLKPGDILLLHDSPAKKPHQQQYMLCELEAILQGITRQGLQVVPLPSLLGLPLMERIER